MFTKYYNFFNVFSKKKIDDLSLHKKHDYCIKLKKEKTHKYASFYNMLKDKLLLIKKHLQEYLNKEVIKLSIALYTFFILFAKKFDENLRFCVNY